jgi:hypothetical protein
MCHTGHVPPDNHAVETDLQQRGRDGVTTHPPTQRRGSARQRPVPVACPIRARSETALAGLPGTHGHKHRGRRTHVVPGVGQELCKGGGPVAVQGDALAGPAGLWDVRSATPRRPPQGLPPAAPEAELYEPGRRLHRGLPPSRRTAGLRQVDGMPREPGCGLAEQTRSEPPASACHATRRTSRNAQVNRHATTPDVSRRQSASAFGTKRSQVQILSPRPTNGLVRGL